MHINQIELSDLRAVVALAEELNFGRAAERLLMSQPPLTRLLADVEKGVGARLFERTTRRVDLTAVGEVFVTEARATLARMEEAMQAVSAAARRQTGHLRLAYTPLALQTVLPRLLAALRERDHEAQIDLLELLGQAQIEALASGRVDLAFADGPPAGAEFGSLCLHREPLDLLVPEGHPLAARAAVTLEDLGETPLILHSRSDYPDYYDRLLAVSAALPAPLTIRERRPGENCLALVSGGAGVLLTPGSLGGVPAPGLCRLRVETPLPLSAEVWAVWSLSAPSAPVRALIALVQASVSDGPPGTLPL